MQQIKLELSSDGTHAALSVAGATAKLSAPDIDRLIRDLAALRARMTPIHPAEPPDDPAECTPSARPGARAPHAWLRDGRSIPAAQAMSANSSG